MCAKREHAVASGNIFCSLKFENKYIRKNMHITLIALVSKRVRENIRADIFLYVYSVQ
jgi:hypothetical protein